MAVGDAAPAAARPAAAGAPTCRSCSTQLAPALLACPSCGALTRASELTALASAADEAERAGDLSRAAAAWRDALDMLPRTAPQHAAVVARIDELTRRIDAAPAAASSTGAAQGSALRRASGAIGAAAIVLLSKAKLLLLGLTKLKTLLSMLAFVGVYWGLYGWPLAVGFVASIYVHEMGHVAALARYGIRAGAPMFVPGLGAFVRLKQYPASAREDAVVGLAGPLWGLGAAVVSCAVYYATAGGVWGAIAALGAWVNLFNLTPVWQLDGARGFRALSRGQRWAAAGTAGGAALVVSHPILWLVAAVGAYRAFAAGDAPPSGDRRAFATYLALVAALTLIGAATASVGR